MGGSALAGRRVVVLGQEATLIDEVVSALRARGARAETYSGSSAPPAAHAWDGIVDLNLTGTVYRFGDSCWREPLRITTAALQSVYPAWVREPRYGHHFYLAVTHLGGLMGYDEIPLPQPLGGIWAGLAKGLRFELPAIGIKVVDLDTASAPAIARAVESECAAWDRVEVGYRAGRRHGLTAGPRDVPAPTIDLGPADTVLISGGARGVGFAVARGLAESFGCRVVVTGRGELPTTEPWLSMNGEQFARWKKEQLGRAATSAQFGRLRKTLARVEHLREIDHNLRDAARAGLRVEYARCDCTDAEQVEALVASLTPGPSMVVHNAVADEWRRFDRRSIEEVQRSVEVKIDGFATLLGAVTSTPRRRGALRLVCNVGSVSGRVGGMVGQVAYSGANDGLARLGMWARNAMDVPVQTLCWATWDGLGNVPNHEAAARYGSMVDPTDGVRRWLDEIRAAHREEVVFLGDLGEAILPTQLAGLRDLRGFRGLKHLVSLEHYLGEVESYEEFRSIRSSTRLRAGAHPCLSEFRVDGRDALPVSVLLEYGVATGHWVVPAGRPRLHLTEIRDIGIRLDRLTIEGDHVSITKEGHGAFRDGRWQVRVEITRRTGEPVAAMTLVYDDSPATIPRDPLGPPGGRPAGAPARGGLDWTGVLFPPLPWLLDAQGGRAARLPLRAPADLWTKVSVPDVSVSPGAIEALVQAVVGEPGNERAFRLRMERLVLGPGARRVRELHASADLTEWIGAEAAGRPPAMLAEGVRAALS
ncbi:KR domain-containing protein [Actinoallomurus spadix]|uniref:KR domain-containing protein n=1 Tax=Actinoallomurus spadix TaxID=79912 RepID=UPI00209290F4|nr:KR domain-containing protein [Actinoallomurus spadix]MCO5989587.1 KR domain-containing protein [Actinoallomurus spadix]